MDNQNESTGVRILTTEPMNHALNVNVHSNLQFTFTADLNPKSLVGSIIVFEDLNGQYVSTQSIKEHPLEFSSVAGTLSYRERTVIFAPKEPLSLDRTYIVLTNDTISDITGNRMAQKYVYTFHTEKSPSYLPCKIVYPTYGLILNETPVVTFESQNAPSYTIQMSKSKEFETLLLDDIFVVNEDPEYKLPELSEGAYYIRMKTERGSFGDAVMFFIKETTKGTVAREDAIPDLDEFLSQVVEPIEVLEQFPAPNDLQVSNAIRIVYVKLKGQVDPSRIDFDQSYITKTSLEDDDPEEQIVPLDHMTYIYDDTENVTYLIGSFSSIKLDDVMDSSMRTELIRKEE